MYENGAAAASKFFFLIIFFCCCCSCFCVGVADDSPGSVCAAWQVGKRDASDPRKIKK